MYGERYRELINRRQTRRRRARARETTFRQYISALVLSSYLRFFDASAPIVSAREKGEGRGDPVAVHALLRDGRFKCARRALLSAAQRPRVADAGTRMTNRHSRGISGCWQAFIYDVHHQPAGRPAGRRDGFRAARVRSTPRARYRRDRVPLPRGAGPCYVSATRGNTRFSGFPV